MSELRLLILLLSVLFWSCQSDNTASKEPSSTTKDDYVQNPKNLMLKTFQFELGTDSLTVEIALDSSLREQYKRTTHEYSYQGNKLPANWREEYYQMFISHPDDQKVIRQLIDQLTSNTQGTSSDELVETVTAFVQGSVTYDWNTYYNLDNSTIRYPYETLVDGTGVCADKTILLARLLNELGYGLAIFTFERANHMALGIKVPNGFDNFRSGYAFIESTNYAPIGRIPDNYVGGLKLGNRPSVIRINSSDREFAKIEQNRVREQEMEKKYGKEFFFLTAEQKDIKMEMTVLQADLDSLKKEMRGCNGTLPKERYIRCNELQEQHNSRVEKFNGLVARFNSLNQAGGPPA